MDAGQSHDFPPPEPNVPEEVRTALTTASHLWSSGSHVDALRWLRRAAETAADEGDDMRSVALARRAADLRTLANIAGSMPPAASAPPPRVTAETQVTAEGAVQPGGLEAGPHNPAQTVPATPAAGAAAALQAASEEAQAVEAPPIVAEAPPIVAQAPPIVAEAPPIVAQAPPIVAEAPPIVAQAPAIVAQEDQASPASAQRVDSKPTETLLSAEALTLQGPTVGTATDTTEEAAPQSAPEADPTNGPTPVEGVPAFGPGGVRDSGVPESNAVEQAPAQTASPSEPPPSFGSGFQTHYSVRVALGSKPDADGQFSVHPLAEGESVDPGWREALLVALEPGARLFPGRS